MSRRAGLLSFMVILFAVVGYCLFRSEFWITKGTSPGPFIAPARERQAMPVPLVRFTDKTESAGIHFRHFNGATGKKLLPETMGAGVAVLDFDGDGLQDLLFVNGCPWPGSPTPPRAPQLALYRNRGN